MQTSNKTNILKGDVNMTLKKLVEMYDDWNGITKVNDNNLKCIVKDKTLIIIETRKDLLSREVVSFGFYDNEFCIRIK
jgi:hypothetical protein